jgi:hypothetical protein
VLVDHRAALRRAGKLNQRGSRVIGRKIKAALVKDGKQRVANVGDKIEGLLLAGELKEAWQCLKGWDSMVKDRAPKACHETLVRQTEERIVLYTKFPPRGGIFPSMYNLSTFLMAFLATRRLGEWLVGYKTDELLEQRVNKLSTLRCGCEM